MPGLPAGTVLQQLTRWAKHAIHEHSDLGLVVQSPLMFEAHELCTSRACNQIASESVADLRIDDDAVRTYAASLDVAEVRSAAEQPRLPIRFDSQQSEVRCCGLCTRLQFICWRLC